MASRSAGRRGEFGWLLVGEGASVIGDQLAKVAVSLLVFARTNSPALAALTYALTLLPDLVAGPLLAPLADRYPRRRVMIVCALLQAALAGVMAIHGVYVWILAIAVVGITAGQAPFKAAQAAVLPAVLGPDRVEGGQARLGILREAGQLVGLAGAGAVVGTVGPGWAILGDAVSFLVVALTLAIGVRVRPAPAAARALAAPRRAAVSLIRASRRLRMITWLRLLSALTILPDAVMVPFVRQLGAPNWVIGPLLAADSLGFIAGAWWVDRQAPERRAGILVPLAIVSLATLVPFVLLTRNGLPPSIAVAVAGVLLVASGAGASFLPLTTAQASTIAPDHLRGAVLGLERTVLRAGQGLGAALAGVFAELLGSAAMAIGVGGLVGAAGTLLAALRGRAHSTAPATVEPTTSRVAVTDHDVTSLPEDTERKGCAT